MQNRRNDGVENHSVSRTKRAVTVRLTTSLQRIKVTNAEEGLAHLTKEVIQLSRQHLI
jgi:predicted DNA binding CopG/RHH family protein